MPMYQITLIAYYGHWVTGVLATLGSCDIWVVYVSLRISGYEAMPLTHQVSDFDRYVK